MRKLILITVAAAALAGPTFAYNALAAPGDAPGGQSMHAMAEDREFMLDARLAGMKAELQLTPDQARLWAPFEAAIRYAAKAHMDAMRAMHEGMRQEMQGGERPSPIERMDKMSEHLAMASAEIKMIADAARPLFDSLDEMQKHHFGALLMSLREHPARGEMHEGWEGREGGEMHGGWGAHEGGDMQ